MRPAVILLAAAALAGSPRGASGAEGPTDVLKNRAEEIRSALPPKGSEMTPATRQRIQTIVTRTIDLRGMLEAAMGPRWKEITEAQRKRLIAAFESRFKQTSTGELDPYRSTEIEYQPEAPAPGGAVMVPTRVVVKGEPTEIAYTMRQEKDGWRIVDITVDGVSTVANYKSSFARVIAKDGVDGLIRKLEKGATPQKS